MLVPRIVPNTLIKGDLVVRDDFEFRSADENREGISAIITGLGLTITAYCNPPLDDGSTSLAFTLLESGVEVHTWPDQRYTQLTVHLCDFSRSNYHLAMKLFGQLACFLGVDRLQSKMLIIKTDEFGHSQVARPVF